VIAPSGADFFQELSMSLSDGTHYGPTTHELHDAFVEEIDSLCGHVSDHYHDGDRLFVRAVLPLTDDVVAGDTIHNGIAIRVAGPAVHVHPYTLRQVCTNGAVMPQARQSVRIERVTHDGIVVPAYEVGEILARFAQAVQECAAPEVFARSVAGMRDAMNTSLNLGMHLNRMLHGAPSSFARSVVDIVFAELGGGGHGDRTVFDLANVITAAARDTGDPQTRWQLEEFGGSLMSGVGAAGEQGVMNAAAAWP
jgi:hypothetical protein